MPLSALALVLLAAVLHASWNIAAKHAGGDHRFTLVTSLLTSVLWLPAGLWFGWQEVPRWGRVEWAVVAASAGVHLLYFSALLKGYRVGDLTVVYPLARGSGPLITAAAAVVLLGETLSATGAAGVLGVCGGVFLIAGGPALWRHTHGAQQRARTLAGVRWGLITGTLLRDRAGVATAWRTQWKHALVVAALGPLAYILVLYALTLAPLAACIAGGVMALAWG